MLESITVITLLLFALNRVDLQVIFDRDGYETRRGALPGARLVKVLVVYQLIRSEKMRGLIRAIAEKLDCKQCWAGRSRSIPCPMVCESGISGRWSRPGCWPCRLTDRGSSGWAESSLALRWSMRA